jgi:hypothetical protein
VAPKKTCAEFRAHGYPCSVARAVFAEAEHRRRRNLDICFYCGERGHFSPTCSLSIRRHGGDKPENSPTPTQVGGKVSSPDLSNQPVWFPVKFPEYPSPSLPLNLIDSGAVGNPLDGALAAALRIPLVPLQSPIPVQAMDYCPIETRPVHHITAPVYFLTHGTHSEQITFLIIDTPQECQGRCLAVSTPLRWKVWTVLLNWIYRRSTRICNGFSQRPRLQASPSPLGL